jgi:hypothetical protein
MELFRDMEFDETLEREGFLRKHGALFANVEGEAPERIDFADGLRPDLAYAYQGPETGSTCCSRSTLDKQERSL